MLNSITCFTYKLEEEEKNSFDDISYLFQKTSTPTNHKNNENFKEKSCIRNTNKTSKSHSKACLKHLTETGAYHRFEVIKFSNTCYLPKCFLKRNFFFNSSEFRQVR